MENNTLRAESIRRLWLKVLAYLAAFSIDVVLFRLYIWPADQPLGAWFASRPLVSMATGASVVGFSCGLADWMMEAWWKAKKRRAQPRQTN